jgi:hypothetical protein
MGLRPINGDEERMVARALACSVGLSRRPRGRRTDNVRRMLDCSSGECPRGLRPTNDDEERMVARALACSVGLSRRSRGRSTADLRQILDCSSTERCPVI